MAIPRMRPSFIAEARCRPEDAMAILREQIKVNSQRVEGTFSKRHCVLCRPEERQRFWSPCLDLTVEDVGRASPQDEVDENRIRVWGTFSPRPEIWTGFVFAIGTLVVVSILSLLFAVAQLLLGDRPWALLVPAVAILIAAGLHASALIGQGLSGDDMYQMRAYVDACLQEAEELAQRRAVLPPDASAQL